MHRNKSVDVHQFAMVPKAEIPRSQFRRQLTHKTTFDAGYLIPVYCDEVLPGDMFRFSATMFGRLSTPLFPVMDNMYLDSFFFFVPLRLRIATPAACTKKGLPYASDFESRTLQIT